ncbi:hypothetical protein [Sphingomonas oryzagri]
MTLSVEEAMRKLLLVAIPAVLAGSALWGQAVSDTVKRGGEIVSQPARDVGASKTEIPPVLLAAHDNPYGLAGLSSCRQIRAAIDELSASLGPDFAIASEKKENRVGKLAEAGGKTVVNAFIPFRGLVREISGAAPAQRRLNAAIDAGFARRGFLRGIAYARKCPAGGR